MKNSFLMATAMALLWIGACNRIDTALVASVQAAINKAQDGKSVLDGASQNIANLMDQMAKAPAELKAAPAFGYPALEKNAQEYRQKIIAMAALQTDLRGKLENLLTEYTDGKIKKDEIVKEYEATVTELDGIQQSVDRMAPVFDQISADFAKMMATWQALSESEKAAAVPNQPGEIVQKTTVPPKPNQ